MFTFVDVESDLPKDILDEAIKIFLASIAEKTTIKNAIKKVCKSVFLCSLFPAGYNLKHICCFFLANFLKIKSCYLMCCIPSPVKHVNIKGKIVSCTKCFHSRLTEEPSGMLKLGIKGNVSRCHSFFMEYSKCEAGVLEDV